MVIKPLALILRTNFANSPSSHSDFRYLFSDLPHLDCSIMGLTFVTHHLGGWIEELRVSPERQHAYIYTCDPMVKILFHHTAQQLLKPTRVFSTTQHQYQSSLTKQTHPSICTLDQDPQSLLLLLFCHLLPLLLKVGATGKAKAKAMATNGTVGDLPLFRLSLRPRAHHHHPAHQHQHTRNGSLRQHQAHHRAQALLR